MSRTPSADAQLWIPVLAGQSVGGYVLGAFLGEGGFGLVFEAVDGATGRVAAVKVLTRPSEPEAVTDFENEGELLRRLELCKGVVDVFTSGTHSIAVTTPGGAPMPPVQIRFHALTRAQGSLDELLEDPAVRAQLPWIERLRLWRRAVKCVMQMHQHGVVHRDLKSSNCLLLIRKGITRIRLTDFGRARDLKLHATKAPEAYLVGRGDFRFAPPEALFWQGGMSNDDFVAADYYGLGSLLAELIGGQPMTALAIGDVRDALSIGFADFQAGRRRDLASLRLKYRSVVSELVAELPHSIQADAAVILNVLCSPEPTDRLRGAPFSRDRAAREKLAWVLRRADIMIHRLEIEARNDRLRQKETA
jgi:serine/threonine protein kinase